MELSARDGTRFVLNILRYQFPELATAEYDSNWLLIEIKVETPQGAWTATDPSLLTYEVRELAEWLEAVASGDLSELEMRFLEPNLQFRIISPPDGSPSLRVYFNAECRPPWTKNRSAGGDSWADFPWAGFPLAEVDLRRAALSLRTQLQPYPQRAEH
jgi:hypothetical protein